MRLKLVSLFICICFLFCSCTVQTDFDVFDLCKRYNKLSNEKTLFTSDFLSDKNGSLYCFLTVGESTVLIALDENENKSLENVFVTVCSHQCSETDYNEITDTVYRIFGAFNYGDLQKATEKLNSVGFDSDFSPFAECFRTENSGKYKMTLYSNEYAFTVSQEKNTGD